MLEKTQAKPWQKALAGAITDPNELIQCLDLPQNPLPASLLKEFPLRVPRGFVARMERGNLQDPLLRQVLPLNEEQTIVPGFNPDPLEELDCNPAPGLLHKYSSRVLMMPTTACAVHCRYCFRRHFPYNDNNPGTQHWDAAINYIASDQNLREVIFSGGDPLVATDKTFFTLAKRVAEIPHIKILRIHTRTPIVLPERVDDDFLSGLEDLPLRVTVVLHSNHANEIDDHVLKMMARLRKKGVTILNQSVLLRGVNDSVESLAALSYKLFEGGCLPYYLHQLDRVQGAAHFFIDDDTARQLHTELRNNLPGYLVPRLVIEKPKAQSKEPL